jgi:import inner membrane translocase subunit TIM16
MASKIVAQLIIYGGQFILRGLAEAYRQALANAQTTGAAQNAATTVARRGRMTLEEAYRIVGVRPDSPPELVAERLKRIYTLNDPKNGGSLYLQAKIYGAQRTLEEALKRSFEIPTESSEENSAKQPSN